MKQKIITHALLLLGLAGLTACPNQSNNDRTNAVTPNQAQTNPGTNPNAPGTNNPGGNNPAQSVGGFKSVQCDYEGLKNSNHRFFNTSVGTGRTSTIILLDSRVDSTFDLRTKFLGLDIGKFGKITLKYVPAASTKSGTDTLILVNEGLNKNIRSSQSGFAGQEVKLEATGSGGGTSLFIACKGTSQFTGIASSAGKTSLACHGTSSTSDRQDEDIKIIIPLSTLAAGAETPLSEVLSIKVDKAATQITFIASVDPQNSNAVITSTASLTSSATFTTTDGYRSEVSDTKINVTCKLQ